jgi:hypothetical protein
MIKSFAERSWRPAWGSGPPGNTIRAVARSLVRAGALASFLVCGTALAQEEDPGESRAATFEAAEGAQAEEVPGGALLIGAYGFAWIALFGFIGSIALRQSRAWNDLTRLKKELEKPEGKR